MDSSDNIGFHLNFTNLDVNQEDSYISIVYENTGYVKFSDFRSNSYSYSLVPDNTIYKIEINITPNNTPKIIVYYKINNKFYEKVFTQLKAPVFDGKSSNNLGYNVFVQFTGPTLLVGFTPDTSFWNTFSLEQIVGNSSVSDINYYFEKEKTYISINTQNSSFKWTYSSIIFDNYNLDPATQKLSGSVSPDDSVWETPYNVERSNVPFVVSPITSTDFQFLNTKNYITTQFRTRKDLSTNISEANIYDKMVKSAFLSSRAVSLRNQLPDDPISLFPDWRNNNFESRSISWSDYFNGFFNTNNSTIYTITSSINDSFSAFRFKSYFDSNQTSYPNYQDLLKTNSFERWGKYIFNGTVEGPVFLGSFYDGAIATAPDNVKFLKDIEKGNISSYVSNITIQCSSENTNKSFINNSATIILENLDSTEEGWRILELIENNVIVVTINAGYGNQLQKYFQGAIKSISTTRTGSSSKIALDCQDLSSYLLESVYFEKTISFATLRLGDIIQLIMNASGFAEFYHDLIDRNDGPTFLNNEAYTKRLSTNPLTNQDLLIATQFDRIKAKLDVFLPKMCKIGQQVVFRWEPGVYEVEYGNNIRKTLNGFVFDNRYATHNRDIGFKFTGIENNSITARPDSNDPLAWHGLIVDNFKIITNTKPLAFRVETAGYNLLEGIYATSTDNDAGFNSLDRISPTKLDNVIKSLTSTTNVPTQYVGFRKQIKDIYDRQEFPSKSLTDFKHAQNKEIASKPFHTVSFDCYVTQPLKFWGTFYIKAFDNNDLVDVLETDLYIYSSLTYTIDKSSNLITANVSGIRLPWTISGLEEQSQ